MIIRILIILLIIYYYKDIIHFFNSKKFKKITDNLTNIDNKLDSYDLNTSMTNIKKYNIKIYKNIKKRINIINKIYNNIKNNNMVFKGQYDNIKKYRKDILNLVTELKDNKNINKTVILEIMNEYIIKILKKILKFRDENKNIIWFEEDLQKDDNINIEAFNPNINYNYDIY